MAKSECPFHRLGEKVPIRFMPRIPSPLGKSAENTYYGKKVRGEAMRGLLYLSPALDQTMRQIRGDQLKTDRSKNEDWRGILWSACEAMLSRDLSVHEPIISMRKKTRDILSIREQTSDNACDGDDQEGSIPQGLLALINEGGLFNQVNRHFIDFTFNFDPEMSFFNQGMYEFVNNDTNVICPAERIINDTILIALQTNIYLSRLGVPLEAGVITTTKPSPTNSFGRTWKSREEIIAEYRGIREQYTQAGI